MKEKKKRAKRLPTFAESITPIIAMLLILTIGKGRVRLQHGAAPDHGSSNRGIYRVPCGCYLG